MALFNRKAPIVKTYHGSVKACRRRLNHDKSVMAKKHFYPTSEDYTPGKYGAFAFIFALLLCFVLIGFLVFVYMILVKPAGTLTVTFEYKEPAELSEKTCPQCAEIVKKDAKICRYCGYEFANET